MKRKLLLKVISMALIASTICVSVHKDAYAGQWIKNGQQWQYKDSNGNVIGWTQINNKWYYFDEAGIMATGLLKENNSTYYLSPSGSLAGGWQKIDNKWYFFNSAGSMKKGWIEDKNSKYYLNSNGEMATGWKLLNNEWFHLNEATGKMDTGWIVDKNSKYFFNKSGVMEKGFVTIDNKTYYLKDSGEMATGVLDVNGTKYEFSQNGELVGDSKPNNGRNFTSDGKLVKELDGILAETVHDESEKSDTKTTTKHYYYKSSSSSSGSSSSNNNSNINNNGNINNNDGNNTNNNNDSNNTNNNDNTNNDNDDTNNNDNTNNNQVPTGQPAPQNLTVSHLDEGGNNGTIGGLDPNKKYEYKLREDETYTRVNDGATEITGLGAGIYDIRYVSDDAENINKIFTITLREKSDYNDYITHDDMLKAEKENNSSLQFSNDERIKKVIEKAENSDSSEPINILLIGGSITYGYASRGYQPHENNSYGIKFAEWLEKLFPNREINVYDIGIPSSQSCLANARIQYELDKYEPDIVFVDFAVNDGGSDWDAYHYESLLRNILNSDTEPAVMLPMFSFFDKNSQGRYYVTQPVHCEIGEDYNLPMMRYGRVMQPALQRRGNSDREYEFIKKLGYTYNRDNGRGDLTHPGDEGHKLVADFYEDYFEKILNEYNSNKEIDEEKIVFDGRKLRSNKYDDEKLLNADVIATTDEAVYVEDGPTTVSSNGFTWYEVASDKREYPYVNDDQSSGATYIECDTLPCWETRTENAALTFTNVKGKNIGLWYYYHLPVPYDMEGMPEHYKDGVQGSIRIEMTDMNDNVTVINEDMPVKDFPNVGDNASAYAKYVELKSTNGRAKEYKSIKIITEGDNLPDGQDPNIQILGLVISGSSN